MHWAPLWFQNSIRLWIIDCIGRTTKGPYGKPLYRDFNNRKQLASSDYNDWKSTAPNIFPATGQSTACPLYRQAESLCCAFSRSSERHVILYARARTQVAQLALNWVNWEQKSAPCIPQVFLRYDERKVPLHYHRKIAQINYRLMRAQPRPAVRP